MAGRALSDSISAFISANFVTCATCTAGQDQLRGLPVGLSPRQWGCRGGCRRGPPSYRQELLQGVPKHMHRIKVNYMTCLSSASATFAWPAALQCSGVGQLLMFEVDQGTAGMGDAGGAGGMNVAVSMWSPQGCIGVACGGLIRSDGVALIVLRRVASAPACRTTSSEMQRYRETAISDHLTLVDRKSSCRERVCVPV